MIGNFDVSPKCLFCAVLYYCSNIFVEGFCLQFNIIFTVNAAKYDLQIVMSVLVMLLARFNSSFYL